MLAPMLIERAQHHFLFDVAHHLRADVRLFLEVGLIECGFYFFLQSGAVAASSSLTHASMGSTGT